MTIANSWRATGDVFDTFDRDDPRCPCVEKDGTDCAMPGFHCSVMNIINKVVWFIERSQPGAWNDLDMLEVGNVRAHGRESLKFVKADSYLGRDERRRVQVAHDHVGRSKIAFDHRHRCHCTGRSKLFDLHQSSHLGCFSGSKRLAAIPKMVRILMGRTLPLS